MIRKVHFRNFKGLRQVDVDLERFTVLVGPNASGKTSILEGLLYLSELFKSRPEDWFRNERNPFFLYSRSGEGEMEIRTTGESWPVRFTGQANGPFPANILAPDRAEEFRSRWNYRFEQREEPGAKWKAISPGSIVSHFLLNAVLLRLNPASIANPSVMRGPELNMTADGAGLPSFLAYTQLNRPDEFDQLLFALRHVIPYVQRVRFDRVQILDHPRVSWADTLLFDFVGAPSVPGHLASEGTLLVLALLSAFFRPVRPNLVLIDDLDHGLHPRAQRDLIALLRRVLEQNPQLQIIATTHSPYLLDQLKPEEVRLTILQPDGSVAVARLDAHPDFEKWKEEMTPGEFWSLVGEKWVHESQAVESR